MESTVSGQDEETRIEVSVVGSPEVYGGEQSAPGTTVSNGIHEEQSIEKRDQTPVSEVVILDSGDVSSVGEAVQFSSSIHDQLKLWDWVYIDGTQLPAILRGNDLYLSVHNVQLKLLSRFPPGISRDVLNKYTMISHKITTMEACVLNVVNAACLKFELGCQLFTPEDEIVLVRDVELFYWNIKAINLSMMLQRYEEEIKKAHDNISLMSVITSIKQHVEMEIEKCKTEVQKLESDNGVLGSTRNSPDQTEPPAVSHTSYTRVENINVYS